MLQKEDVTLRALRNSDREFLYQSINNPELVKFNAPYAPIHQLSHEQWFQQVLTDPHKRFFIIDIQGQSVGTIQLFDINLIHRNAELSIRVADARDRGKGVGNSAVSLLVDHAFKDMGLVRVWLRVFANNPQAIRAYEKAGFQAEGTMRQAAFIDGRFLDMIIMAKLAYDAI